MEPSNHAKRFRSPASDEVDEIDFYGTRNEKDLLSRQRCTKLARPGFRTNVISRLSATRDRLDRMAFDPVVLDKPNETRDCQFQISEFAIPGTPALYKPFNTAKELIETYRNAPRRLWFAFLFWPIVFGILVGLIYFDQ